MDFSSALYDLKAGAKIQRSGWNGADLFVTMTPANGEVGAYFSIHKPDGTVQPGWVPSIGDLLADDWRSSYD